MCMRVIAVAETVFLFLEVGFNFIYCLYGKLWCRANSSNTSLLCHPLKVNI